jgi:hypothetical protein
MHNTHICTQTINITNLHIFNDFKFHNMDLEEGKHAQLRGGQNMDQKSSAGQSFEKESLVGKQFSNHATFIANTHLSLSVQVRHKLWTSHFKSIARPKMVPGPCSISSKIHFSPLKYLALKNI